MSKLAREIARFGVAGLCAVGTDMLFYYVLGLWISLSWAKGISFLLGTVTAYLMNKYYTFGQKEKSLQEVGRFGVLYGISLAANIGVNKVCLGLLPSMQIGGTVLTSFQWVKLLAFVLATSTSTVINFIGQKFWVFKGDRA